ncbi:hypothetical protein V1282_005919 [Nitrobacteraceae bacterium AZCC 2146]
MAPARIEIMQEALVDDEVIAIMRKRKLRDQYRV